MKHLPAAFLSAPSVLQHFNSAAPAPSTSPTHLQRHQLRFGASCSLSLLVEVARRNLLSALFYKSILLENSNFDFIEPIEDTRL